MFTEDTAVIATDLTVRRGRATVLHQVGVRMPARQVIGLLGPSGSGKTTLMRSIVGAQRVSSGKVRVLGHRAGHRELRHQIGYMAQSAGVYDDLTVAQNLDYFRRVLHAPPGDTDRVIALTQLGAMRGRLVSTLSGGQRSRVSLATALLGDPQLLVLDEPTVGLDPMLRHELWTIFAQLAASGTTLLVSSHVMDEARRCDHLVLMRDGRVVVEDTPDGLLARTGASNHDEAFLTLIRRGDGDAAVAA